MDGTWKKVKQFRGGLFGIPKGFFGGIECQQKGTLHFHAISFISGLPNICDKFENICTESSDFKKYIEICRLYLSSSSPFDIKNFPCPKCGKYELIKNSKISEDAFRSLNRPKNPPVTIKSSGCFGLFGSDKLLRNISFEHYNCYKKPSEFFEAWIDEVNWRELFRNEKESDKLTRFVNGIPRKIPKRFVTESDFGLLPTQNGLKHLQLIIAENRDNWRHISSCF